VDPSDLAGAVRHSGYQYAPVVGGTAPEEPFQTADGWKRAFAPVDLNGSAALLALGLGINERVEAVSDHLAEEWQNRRIQWSTSKTYPKRSMCSLRSFC